MRRILFLYKILILVLLYSCANPVSPSGGPKDETPPVVLFSEPGNYSVNFKNNRIIIEFDEFVKLKDPNTQILISPPVYKKPEYRLRGKSIIVKFNEPLKENTTYTVFFRNSIVDLNENNPLENFQFVFATGNIIDSMAVRGKIENAFDLEPAPDVYVMLYSNNNDTIPPDSLPYYVYPYYISRSNENGVFELNNVRNQAFTIFALKDINNNYIYDLPNEEIAFLDSLVTPSYYKPIPDTLGPGHSLQNTSLTDSISDIPIAPDTLSRDTTHQPLYKLFLFPEIDSVQKLLEAKLLNNHKLMFAFLYPLKNNQITLIKPDSLHNNWFIEEQTSGKDTVFYYIKDKLSDTLVFSVADDSLILDTVNIVFAQDDTRERKPDRYEEEPMEVKEFIKIENNISGSFDLNKALKLTFPLPVSSFSPEGFLLVEGEDTLKVLPAFTDKINRKLFFKYNWKEGTSYQFIFPDSVFYDITGKSNDSTILRFRTKTPGDYGVIKLNIAVKNWCNNTILQLIYKDKIIREDYINNDTMLLYHYLVPGDYRIKAICDHNRNKKWDTGNYLKKQQPEKVAFFPKTINIRANWEIEEQWPIK